MMNIVQINMISPLCFDRLEKGLSYSIVPIIAFATHTTITALTGLVYRFYLYIQSRVSYLTTAAGPLSPCIKTAAG